MARHPATLDLRAEPEQNSILKLPTPQPHPQGFRVEGEPLIKPQRIHHSRRQPQGRRKAERGRQAKARARARAEERRHRSGRDIP